MSAEVTNEVVVYRARNLVNGHSYIGFSGAGFKRRRQNHLSVARRGKGHRLHAAIRKYGEENFTFEVLADFAGDRDLALVYEQEAIAKYRPEYNLSAGGEGRTGPMTEAHKQALSRANKGQGLGRKGISLTAEQKQRLREANIGNMHMLGRKHSEEAKAKISAAHKGRVHVSRRGVPRSPESVAKVAAALKGRPSIWKGVKRDYGAKVSAALKGKPWKRTEARVRALAVSIVKASEARKRPVVCLNDARIFSSAVEAGAFYGLNPKLVRQQIHRGQRTRSGLKFEWAPK